MRKLLGLFVALWLLWPSVASAADLEARVSVDRSKIAIGEAITAKFEVIRKGRGAPASPEIPQALADAFDIGRCSQGSMITRGTGGSRQTQSLTCPMFAKKAGKHKLGFFVKDGKKQVKSNVLTIEVTEEAEVETIDPTLEIPTRAQGNMFVWVSTDKVKAYVGEQITFRLDVFEARGAMLLEPALRAPPSFEDFFAEDLPLPAASATTIESRPFNIRPGMRRALFPQRAGPLRISETEVTVGRRRRMKSEPIDIEVLSLPAEGQPPNFSPNNVGEYSIFAAVDREQLQPGEPFTLTITLEGEGNIGVADPGEWPEVPGVRRYDPKSTLDRTVTAGKVGGKRTYSFLMIPERPGPLTIPAHTLHYFSPSKGAYASSQTDALELLVGGDPNAVISTDDEPTDATEVTEPLAPVISTESVPRLAPRARWLNESRWTYGMLAVPLLAMAGLGGGLLWRKLGPDDAARAKAQSRQRRKELIERGQAAVETGEGFYTAIAALLQDVALERAGPQGIGLPRPSLLRLLEKRDVSRDERRKLADLFEQCDAARFGAASGTASERQTILDETLDAVRGISKGATT